MSIVIGMRVTIGQLRRIIREEIVRETIDPVGFLYQNKEIMQGVLGFLSVSLFGASRLNNDVLSFAKSLWKGVPEQKKAEVKKVVEYAKEPASVEKPDFGFDKPGSVKPAEVEIKKQIENKFGELQSDQGLMRLIQSYNSKVSKTERKVVGRDILEYLRKNYSEIEYEKAYRKLIGRD